MGQEPRITKLLAWCLLIATTGAFATSIYAQWLEGQTLEMRLLVSAPMPDWKTAFLDGSEEDQACTDVQPPNSKPPEPQPIADLREPY